MRQLEETRCVEAGVARRPRRRCARFAFVAGLGLVAAAAGCSDDPAGPAEVAEFLRSPSRDGTSFQTDRLEYTLAATDYGYAVDIAFQFTNPTGDTAYFVNCNGAVGVVLEKATDAGWTPVWSPVLPACLSQPIAVRPGGTWVGVVGVIAGEFGSDRHPQFATREVTGVYRLRWEPLRTYDPNRYPFGEPFPASRSVSNRFVLRAGS